MRSTMRKVLTVALTLGILVAAARLPAQQLPEVKPGAEHAALKEGEGKWDATIKTKGGESKGTATFKMGLHGLWLLEHFKADFDGQSFEGRGATSYDQHKKKYVNVWIDSMSSTPMLSEGTYDADTKTMTLVGTMHTPDGKAMKVTMTTVQKDADTRTFTLRTGAGAEGKGFEMMQITYKRHEK